MPEGEWLAIIAAQMSGKVGSTWQDLCSAGGGYQDVKSSLLKICGYTPKLAGEGFFGFKSESLRGMSADQVYHRGAQLLRRIVAPLRMSPELEFAILKPWVWSIVAKKSRMILDARVVSNSAELIEALQDYLVLEGERTEGQAAVFRRQSFSEAGRDRPPLTCFSCGKIGHKAAECWGAGENSIGFVQPAAGSSYSSNSGKITCFTCGEPGHKSTQCPNRDKKESNLLRQIKAEPKEPVKSVRRIKGRQSMDTRLQMKVNSQVVSVLLDSGSSVTVVPGGMVAEAQKTGDTVAIKGYGAKNYIELPMAEIPFEVGGMSWVESVALAPKGEEFEEEGVVFGLNLRSERGFSLVRLANEGNPANQKLLDSRAEMTEEAVKVCSSVETVVEEEEESEDASLEFVENLVEVDDSPMRLRRLVVLSKEEKEMEDGGEVGGEIGGVTTHHEPDASVVKGEGSELEACTQVSHNLCFNLMPPPKHRSIPNQQMEQLDLQSRSTGFVSVVGGDVGTAHRRRDREKEKEESKEE